VTVYVDDMRLQATVPNGTRKVTGRWSHLMADTEEELIQFAEELGMNPRWIQHRGTPDVHFDVVDSRRLQALRMGAVSLPCRSAAWMAFFKAQRDKFVRRCANCKGPLRYEWKNGDGHSSHWFTTSCEAPVPGYEGTKRKWMPKPVEDWWEEECVRVSGNIICKVCDKPYWKHPYVAKKEAPTLVRACDGRLLKL
jgi:hypothetical protein